MTITFRALTEIRVEMRYRAHCNLCGWNGRAWRDDAQAIAESAAHRRAHHPGVPLWSESEDQPSASPADGMICAWCRLPIPTESPHQCPPFEMERP